MPAKKKPAPYTGQAVYDGKRPLTARQLARAKETVRKSKAAKPVMAWGIKVRGKLACETYASFTAAKYHAMDWPDREIVRVRIVEVRR